MTSYLPGYARLVELAEQRLSLLQDGRFADAVAVGQEQFRVIEELPVAAPPEAEPLLCRLAELWAECATQIEVGAGKIAYELGRLRRSRPALLAYVAGPEAARSVDRSG
jgi:hypothetical protein